MDARFGQLHIAQTGESAKAETSHLRQEVLVSDRLDETRAVS